MEAVTIYDKIIIGAGLYGLFSAVLCAKKGETVLVLEYDDKPFSRATYINQARVHNGYHYPRSLSTALKSARYFDRFIEEFKFCINFDFKKVYATSAKYSWTDADQFIKFCSAARIKCERIDADRYFKPGACDGVFDTEEYTYDAMLLKEYYIAEVRKYSNIGCQYGTRIKSIKKDNQQKIYTIFLENGESYSTRYLLNTTYASVNQILEMAGFAKFKIKYELCEIILCKVNEPLKNIGITVMDGPFFSIMPFGKTGLHSLTSVTFTPHLTSYDPLPKFICQHHEGVTCSEHQLGNCNICPGKPKTAWNYMHNLAMKYLKDEVEIEYVDSLFSIKPILLASEIDDSRPTIIRQFSKDPTLVTVLSGKINTMYDLEEILLDGN